MPGSKATRDRVCRLLEGRFRVDDLARLFLWLRGENGKRAHGFSSIIEIAHSVAHPYERERGPVTETLRLFFLNIQFLRELRSGSFDANSLPPDIPFVAENNLKYISEAIILEQTGLKKQAAQQYLARAIKKLEKNPHGSLRIGPSTSDTEMSALQCALQNFVVRSFMTPESLWKDFCQALELNKVLFEGERDALSVIRPSLLLFPVATFHETHILLPGGSKGWLVAEPLDGKIVVRGVVPFPVDGGLAHFVFKFFDSGLEVANWCGAELLNTESHLWPRKAIELREDGKLNLIL